MSRLTDLNRLDEAQEFARRKTLLEVNIGKANDLVHKGMIFDAYTFLKEVGVI